MLNNFESNGAVNNMKNSKSIAHHSEIFDQNNNEKCFKDRNVPNEYKFNDSSGKFKCVASTEAVATSDQENDKETTRPNNLEANLSLYQTKVNANSIKFP